MTYASLMAHLELGQSNSRLLRITADLAQRFDASVTGIVACQPMPMVYADGFVPAALFEQDSEIIAKQMNEAEAEFRSELRARAGRLAWRHSVMSGPLADYIASEARHADLIITGVVPKDLFDSSRSVNTGDLIMQAGRPVLVVPDATEQVKLERMVVGWKDSRETRRAIADALPLLKQASSVSVAEIAVEDAMPAARAHVADVVAWLQGHGIVELEDPGQVWHIGPGTFRAGSAFLKRTKITERARAPMQALRDATGETVSLGIEAAGEVLFLAQVEATADLRAFFPPGSTGLMHLCAPGKALLAWYATEKTEEILQRKGMTRATTLSLSSPESLSRDLARTRERGFAIDDQERAEGMRGVAAPIFNAFAEPIAVISIAGPTFRMGLSDATRFGSLVRASADQITEATGGQRP